MHANLTLKRKTIVPVKLKIKNYAYSRESQKNESIDQFSSAKRHSRIIPL